MAGKVGLVSGGGSGHEPLHGGYVGMGMLDAAVPGAVFTSPTPDQILPATLAVNSGAGVVHIVKNYTGDRLNFGLAAERAKNLGVKVAMVVVSDDIALPDADQPRGLAGTVLVHNASIRSILKNGLDRAVVDETPDHEPLRHGNIRGQGYFH